MDGAQSTGTQKYEPTLSSLNSHPLPQWYADAKLGIFVHWELYSVPGWAPLQHPNHDFTSLDYIKNNPYAEWYYNVMRVPGSPTQAYHREHFGANFNYYDFAPVFDRETQKWNPDQMAKAFKDAGARYVVLTTKHHAVRHAAGQTAVLVNCDPFGQGQTGLPDSSTRTERLKWSQHGADLHVQLPAALPGNYAYVLQLQFGN
jgi:hypothetical protein